MTLPGRHSNEKVERTILGILMFTVPLTSDSLVAMTQYNREQIKNAAKAIMLKGLIQFSDASRRQITLTGTGRDYVKVNGLTWLAADNKTIPHTGGDAIPEQGQGDSGDDRSDPVDPQV